MSHFNEDNVTEQMCIEAKDKVIKGLINENL